MAVVLTNNATSLLAGAIDAAATTLSIDNVDAGKFPNPAAGDWFPLTIVDNAGNMEIMKATARAGTIITVERAKEDTSAKAYAAGARVDVRLTAGAISEFTTTATVGIAIAGADSKETPNDGDLFVGISAGVTTLFKSPWSSIKAALAGLFLKKAGDTMTGSLRINASGGGILLNKHASAPAGMGDAFITNDSTGNLTMWDAQNARAMYQYNMIARQFNVNGAIYGTNIGTNGDTYGTAWGGWLSDNLNSRMNARILKDGANYAGFASGDQNLPYFRHEATGNVIFLARRDQVVARVAELEAGAWGSYAFLYFAGSGSIGPGAGVAGNQLRFSSAWGNSNTAAPGGSWRCMGYCDSNVQTARTTLWLRYA